LRRVLRPYSYSSIYSIYQVELADEDVESIIQTLVYDNRLEEVRGAIAAMTGKATGKQMYKIAKPMVKTNYYTDIPCGVCPVVDRCFEGGVISPQSCVYMAEWLRGDDVW
jgi:DNA-directed RNA polymerase III subunit RPC6